MMSEGVLLHVSDVHFGAENAAAAEAFSVYARAIRPSAMIVTGDITQMGRRREFQGAAQWLERLPRPMLLTPGNHDTPYWDLVARLISPWTRFETATGVPSKDQTLRARGLVAHGVNTARGAQLRANWSKGVIDLDQVREAAARMAQSPDGDLRVLAVHHPLIEMIGGPMTGEVRRGRAAAELVAELGVDLVLSGHVHVPFALPISLGDHCSYAVGAGTLSLRERGMPASFNRLDWNAERVEVSALAWSGSHFAPWRTWSLPRRRTARAATAA